MEALKAYNTEDINRFHQRKVHNTEIVETPQDEPPGPPVPENNLPVLILTATPLTAIRRLRLPSSNPSHWHTK